MEIDNIDIASKKHRGNPKWKKGVSGNPIGRPKALCKAKLSITNELINKLQEKPDGQSETYLELLIKRIIKQGIGEGDTQIIKLIWSYLEGLPKQSVDVNQEIITEIQVKIITTNED